MPIYEYYCPDNNTVYQFFARTLAQGRTIPRCPDNPSFRLERMLSSFAVVSAARGKPGEDAGSAAEGGGLDGGGDPGAGGAEGGEDPRMASALDAMEREFAHVDENDPKAMGRMMRRMAELTGEKIDGEMEEVVRKLEEGADPESLEESLGGDGPDAAGSADAPGRAAGIPAAKRIRRAPPVRDPHLYDYGDS